MKFVSLEFKNFLSFEHGYMDLDNQGILAIVGENLDETKYASNGAGKSVLMDALTWALWGQTARGLKHDAVVNRVVGKDCWAKVIFEEDGVTYEVQRFRKHSTHKKPNDVVFTVDGDSAEGASMDQTQQHIEMVLGMDFDTFCLLSPGAGIKVADLTDAKLKAYLESILQAEVMSDAQALAKEKLKELEKQKALADLELSQHKDTIDRLNGDIETIESNIASLVELRESEVVQTEAKLKEYQQQLKEQKKELADILAAEAEMQVLAHKIEQQSVRYSDYRTTLDVMESAFQDAETQHKIELAELETSKKSVWNRLKSIEELGAVCESCEQDVDDAHKHELEKNYHDEHDRLCEEIITLNHNFGVYESSSNKKIAKMQEEVQKAKDKLIKLRTKNNDLGKQAYHKTYIEKAILRTQELIEDVKHKDADPYSLTIEKYEKEIVDKGHEVKKLTDKCSKHSKSLKTIEKSIAAHKFWVKGFSAKGLRNHMLKHVVPILSERANYYADVVTDGAVEINFATERELSNGKKKEEFVITIDQKNGGEEYTGLSKGEKARVDLILAFALGDLAYMFAKKRLPFRWLDEPFENIDAAGHEAVAKLLEEQKQKYSSVYCITHADSLQALFPRSILVRKENGTSQIVED